MLKTTFHRLGHSTCPTKNLNKWTCIEIKIFMKILLSLVLSCPIEFVTPTRNSMYQSFVTFLFEFLTQISDMSFHCI